MNDPTEAAQDRLLREALGPADTADLSRRVLSRLAAPARPRALVWPHELAEALSAPLPAAGTGLALLLGAGAAGYAVLPALMGEGLGLILLVQGVF